MKLKSWKARCVEIQALHEMGNVDEVVAVSRRCLEDGGEVGFELLVTALTMLALYGEVRDAERLFWEWRARWDDDDEALLLDAREKHVLVELYVTKIAPFVKSGVFCAKDARDAVRKEIQNSREHKDNQQLQLRLLQLETQLLDVQHGAHSRESYAADKTSALVPRESELNCTDNNNIARVGNITQLVRRVKTLFLRGFEALSVPARVFVAAALVILFNALRSRVLRARLFKILRNFYG